ncbi:MAG: hypothetical protein ACRD63_18005, partial [Pyrinomonadaceae bacterium]
KIKGNAGFQPAVVGASRSNDLMSQQDAPTTAAVSAALQLLLLQFPSCSLDHLHHFVERFSVNVWNDC